MAAIRLASFAGRRCLFTSLRPSLGALGAISTVCISPRYEQAVPKSFSTTTMVQASSIGRHWMYERVVAVGLLGLIPAGFVYPGAVVDYGLAILIPLHGHWGYMSVIEDYVWPSLKAPSRVLLYFITAGTMGGLLYLNYYDIGICNAVKLIWSF